MIHIYDMTVYLEKQYGNAAANVKRNTAPAYKKIGGLWT
jgi:hypothetical protein